MADSQQPAVGGWKQMSDIRIDREGTWFYRGIEMSRRDIINHFYRHLLMEDSDYFIQIGSQRFKIDVEDAPYVVRAVYRTGDGGAAESIRLLLSDDCIEELNPESLKIGEENVLYCRVKSGAFDARFSRSSYYHLADCIKCDSPNSYFIKLNGRVFYLANASLREV
jgi:uncharacterized protein